ncbi:hypothetical protein [Micromonospora sp. NPDC023956]|uniref:hypothetical protein n=1 Tax=Micromonospora sp. NPDC023956 TaxID=3155722 RepID=UPI0033ED459F
MSRTVALRTRRAGGVDVFAGAGDRELSEINAEALAAANVDLRAIGRYQQDEDVRARAEKLFNQFPPWPASKRRTYTSVSDSFYLGPLDTIAVKRISDAVRAG